MKPEGSLSREEWSTRVTAAGKSCLIMSERYPLASAIMGSLGTINRPVSVYNMMDVEIGDPCLSNFSCPGEIANNELVALTAKLDSLGEPEEKAGCCYLR